jgi:murein DD-endopeptidase MepM/ murein hydrolase activator NlpD
MPRLHAGSLRFVAAFAALASVLTVAAVSRAANAPDRATLQHNAADARERVADARRRESDLGAQIDAQSRAIDGVEGRVAALGSELAALENRLSRSRAELARIDGAAARTARRLSFTTDQFSLAQARLGERLAAIYTSGQPQVVEFLLGASSLDAFLDRVDARERVVEQDSQLAVQLKALKAQLARDRVRLAALRSRRAAQTVRLASAASSRRAAYEEVVAERDRLVALRGERQRSLASVSVDRRQWEAHADALAGANSQVAAATTGPPPTEATTSQTQSGGFIWPVRGSVVSPFGQRWGRLHAGLDISAPAGTPIVASAAGRVAFAGAMSGYGLIVVIQHAGNIATAYAHNSRIGVSVGQSVGQGQTIAAVGCTGSCSGDHVHFELRVGGTPVDPMQYL